MCDPSGQGAYGLQLPSTLQAMFQPLLTGGVAHQNDKALHPAALVADGGEHRLGLVGLSVAPLPLERAEPFLATPKCMRDVAHRKPIGQGG